jgi:hypothetical protein
MKKILFLIVFCSVFTVSAQTQRKVLLLDLTNINSETNSSRFYSGEFILNNISVPYDVASDFTNLQDYPVVVTASRIKIGVLSTTQIAQIINYVNDGGVLISSAIQEPELYATFGISASTSNNALFELTFDTDNYPTIFEYINDDFEKTISLGRASNGTTFFTKEYTVDDGEVLGVYENNKPGLIHNSFGLGHAYAFGPDFRDVVYRNLMGLDIGAQRTYSNGFEPTTDVVFMIIRNMIRKHIPNTIYPHTMPSDVNGVVLVTHDIDSKTGYDLMYTYSQYEMDRGFSAQYNATTNYFIPSWSSYYPSAFTSVDNLIAQGHKVSSHSVGHFPDFGSFDLGVLGNNESNYFPVYDNGVTVGGTVLGELEFSKDLLGYNSAINIRTFRSGHLVFPDSLVLGLQMLGYEFNSSQSANDVLTNFPYEQMELTKFTTVKSSVLEIPMTISDVFKDDPISEDNYLEKVAIWGAVTRQNSDNHSPVTLLIHPNRDYKLAGLIRFISHLPWGTIPYNFEDYGDFWRSRQQLDFTTVLTGNVLDVNFSGPLPSDMSFLAETDPSVQINFYNSNNQPVTFLSRTWNATQTLYFQSAIVGVSVVNHSFKELQAYPNPTTNQFYVDVSELRGETYRFRLFDCQGNETVAISGNTEPLLNYSLQNLPTGLYYYVIESKTKSFSGKVVKN